MNEFNLNFYKGKKVLVTGHTGFKGTWLCRILQELGAEVTGYSQKPPTDPSIFTLTDLESQIHSVIGDIRDLEHMDRKIRCLRDITMPALHSQEEHLRCLQLEAMRSLRSNL